MPRVGQVAERSGKVEAIKTSIVRDDRTLVLDGDVVC
jgi:hypothetical protein